MNKKYILILKLEIKQYKMMIINTRKEKIAD